MPFFIVPIIIGIISFVIFVVIAVFVIKQFVHASKSAGNYINKVKHTIVDKFEQEKNKNICPYCGNTFKPEETKCSGCGANRKN